MLISAGANFIHLFLLPCLASSLASPTGAQPSAALGHRAQLGEPLLFSGTVSLAQQLQAQPCAEVTLTVCLCSGEQEVKFQTEHKTSRLHQYQLHRRYLDVCLDISYYFAYPRDSFLLKYQSSLSLQ